MNRTPIATKPEHTKKVMLIEPNETLRVILTLQFKLAHYQIQTFVNHETALAALPEMKKPYPDTIVMDLEPSSDALDILSAIEGMLPTATLVVMMPSQKDLAQKIYQTTKAHILYKPFQVRQLWAFM